MIVTKSAPYSDRLEKGAVLNITLIAGIALIEFFIRGVAVGKFQTTGNRGFGPYTLDTEFVVTHLSGTVDADIRYPLLELAPANVDSAGNVLNFINPFNSAAANIAGGTINGATIGQTTPAAVRTSNLAMAFTDSTATPGSVTNNSPRGKVSFAAGQSVLVVTNSLVTAASSILADLNTVDGALNAIFSCIAGAGVITMTANAPATTAGVARADFIVIN